MTAPAGTEVVLDGRTVRLSNLDKVFWPAAGVTKGDMVAYYLRAAPAIVPHVTGRPSTLHRFPDGVDGTHWYETRCPPHPPWVRTQHMHTFTSGKDVHAPVLDDAASLAWAANAAAIEVHPFLGCAPALDRPTVAVFDLDPGAPAGLLEAATLALRLRAVLEGVGLASFSKTSGGAGLHVYVPLNRPHTFAETKAFARTVARHLVEVDPAGVTDVMSRSRRAGKVFVDWSQNDAGKSTIAPYSLRGLTFPTVSMPVSWDEVDGAVRRGVPGLLTFLLHDVDRRLDQSGDRFEPVLRLVQSLPGT